jgi:hypothetical protein
MEKGQGSIHNTNKKDMKQTAVQWLVDKLNESGIPLMKDELEMINQANEMFEQQIKDAYDDGNYAYGMGIKEPEQYYNETFKTK